MTDGHYEGTRATDGTDLSSRRKHAEYMKRNDLAMATDYTQTWAKASKAREDMLSGKPFDSRSRRESIAKAMYEKWKP
jgi:hypothetical protein